MNLQTTPSSVKAFTLIEIIIVVALVAFIYSVALPSFGIKSSTDVASALGQINMDVRAAYDMSILSAKPYRLAFSLGSNEYWLEESSTQEFYLGDSKVAAEPTKDEIAEKETLFISNFEKYEELAGETFIDPDGDKKVPPSSPVLMAKEKLKGGSWTLVESLEWKKRSITPILIIKDIQAEHHERPISVEEHGEGAMAYIYFFPRGYVEKAVLHIFYRLDEHDFDQSKPPYTILTKSSQGEAQIFDGMKEINIHEEKEGDEDEASEKD